jgi:quercetin dioxygenase-like cupin family protein
MRIEGVPFTAIDWATVAPTTHPGEQGVALWRTLEVGDARVRVVEYSPGYVADHWCSRGHIILVVEGELETELQGGRVVTLRAGMGYHVASDEEPHRSRTRTGAKLFIVD